MNTNSPSKNEGSFLISIKDCNTIIKKGKFKILICAFVFTLLATLYPLSRPVLYEAEASFKEKNNSQTGLNSSSIASFLFNNITSGNKSETTALMKSHKLLSKMIHSLGLQANLVRKGEEPSFINNFQKNLILELKQFNYENQLPLQDPRPILKTTSVSYEREIPLNLTLKFENEDTFTIYDKRYNIRIDSGTIGTPFSGDGYQFRLDRLGKDPLTGETYFLSLYPLKTVSKKLSKELSVLMDKEDPTLLKLKYPNRDRHLAAVILNQVMGVYQDYLKDEQKRISKEQITYLNSRQSEMGKNLRIIVDEYADQLALDLVQGGYARSEKMLDFLTQQLYQYWEKMLTIELELKRRSLPQSSNEAIATLFLTDRVSEPINKNLIQINVLKQNRDALELALRNSSEKDIAEWQDSFQQQVSNLEEIGQAMADAQLLLASLEKNAAPLPSVKLLDNPSYTLKTWNDQLLELASSESSNKDREDFKMQFMTYLSKLLHYLEINEKTIQERLAHQQAPQSDFQGINLISADQLYNHYGKELSELQAKILQLQFVVNQLHDNDFEVTSLSSVVEDRVAIEMVSNASKLILALHDESNYSTKEKDRLKKELQMQKRFLDLHLNQAVQLYKIQENVLKNKMRSLQKASLDLTHQEISIREKDLGDHIDLYFNQLELEHDLLKEKELDIRQEMLTLPKRWASEKLVDQELKINVAMVEEIAKIVESKNISSNLEMIQSAPLDISITPTHPLKPKVLLFATLGGVIGLILGIGGQLASSAFRGIPASKENLELADAHVAGSITQTSQDNRDTLRRLIIHVSSETPSTGSLAPKGSTLALINGSGIDPAQEIALLMHKKGWKVLLLDLMFDQAAETGQSPTLLQYLEGQAAAPIIQHTKPYDEIKSGGKSPFANELMSSKAFINLVEKLKSQYDWIIGISDVPPNSPEAETLFKVFDHAVVNIHGESIEELNRILLLAQHDPNKKVSFIFSK